MPKNTWAAEEVECRAQPGRGRNANRRIRQCARTAGCCAGQVGREAQKLASNFEEESATTKVYSYNETCIAVEGQSVEPRSNPLALLDSQEYCNDVIQRLEDGDQVQRLTLLLWLHKASLQLALSKSGCRVVQKVLEVTGGTDRDLIIEELKDHITTLHESPHGNHVLSRAIEVLPAAKIGFIISALLGRGVTVSKHRFGCRVVCRLIEHCTEEQIGSLLDEVLDDAEPLARHAYGNFVVQTALEHCTHVRRSRLFVQLLPGFPGLATHRTGSLVAQRLLDFCNHESQELALRALLSAKGECSLAQVACSHYGSYVVEQVAALRHKHIVAREIEVALASTLQDLAELPAAQRVAIAFGLATSEQFEQLDAVQ